MVFLGVCVCIARGHAWDQQGLWEEQTGLAGTLGVREVPAAGTELTGHVSPAGRDCAPCDCEPVWGVVALTGAGCAWCRPWRHPCLWSHVSIRPVPHLKASIQSLTSWAFCPDSLACVILCRASSWLSWKGFYGAGAASWEAAWGSCSGASPGHGPVPGMEGKGLWKGSPVGCPVCLRGYQPDEWNCTKSRPRGQLPLEILPVKEIGERKEVLAISPEASLISLFLLLFSPQIWKSHVVYFENRNFPGPPSLQGQDHLFPPFISSLGAECSPSGCECWRLASGGKKDLSCL